MALQGRVTKIQVARGDPPLFSLTSSLLSLPLIRFPSLSLLKKIASYSSPSCADHAAGHLEGFQSDTHKSTSLRSQLARVLRPLFSLFAPSLPLSSPPPIRCTIRSSFFFHYCAPLGI